MPTAQALKPTLFTLPQPGGDALPQLLGGRCRCGHVFFPMQTYGCEKCGARGDALTPAALPARGSLVASARVLLHAAKDRQPPFVVVSVRLDDGPVLRTLLDQDSQATLPIGAPLRGCLVEVGRSEAGDPLLDLRFTLAH